MGLSMDTQRNNTGRMSGFSESRPKAKNSSSVRVQSGSKITDNSGNLIMHTMSNLNHVFNSSNRSQGHKSDYVKVSGAHGVNSKGDFLGFWLVFVYVLFFFVKIIYFC